MRVPALIALIFLFKRRLLSEVEAPMISFPSVGLSYVFRRLGAVLALIVRREVPPKTALGVTLASGRVG